MIVIDASVAIKWFAPAEDNRDAALEVLSKVGEDPNRFAVPELFFNEMLAVLCRATEAAPAQIQSLITQLESLGLRRVGNGHELLASAAELAVTLKLSGYDAIYLACAQLLDGVWLTADARAAKRATGDHARHVQILSA